MKRKLVTLLLLTFILSLIPATPVFAQGPDGGGQVIFGRNLTLDAEETVNGDVVVFGGNVTMPASSAIKGDLAVFGGNANINGTVEGDIAIAGGNANLGKTAVVKGDIALLGGKANIAEGAVVEGNVVRPFGPDFNFDFEEGPTAPRPPEVPPVPPTPRLEFPRFVDRAIGFFENLAWNIAMLIGLAAVSWLVATFMPIQMKQTGDAVAAAGPMSFGLGLLTVVVSVVIGIPLLITICLAFIPLLAYVVIGIAVLFGWIVIGQMIGERLLSAAGQVYPNFVLSTVVGTMVLTIVANMPVISWIPCIGIIFGLVGGLFGAIVSLTGLGAVILTRFGTRPYTPAAPRYRPKGPQPEPYTAEELADLDVNPASEEELKAKIKAALDTAPADAEPPDEPAGDAPEGEPEPKP